MKHKFMTTHHKETPNMNRIHIAACCAAGLAFFSMGAASALEAVACVMTIQTGVYPPTMSYETPDPECPLNVVSNSAVTGKADVVLNNSLAFGGYDVIGVPAPMARSSAQPTSSMSSACSMKWFSRFGPGTGT